MTDQSMNAVWARILRKTLVAAGLLLAAALLLLLLGFAVLQTGAAKNRIARVIKETVSDEKTRVEVNGLRGLLPFDIRLKRFALTDSQGTWLAMDDVRLNWSFPALFLARLQIDEISVARINLDHLPESEEKEEEIEDKEPFRIPTSLPELPGFIPAIALEQLALDEINLGEAVVGEAMSLALLGQLRTVDDRSAIEADLQLKRLDRDTLNARLAAILGLYPLALDLNLTVEETGGLVARLAGRPAMNAIHLRLEGQGPLSGWQGRLKAEVKSIATVDNRLTFGITDQPFFGLNGAVFPEKDLLPVDTLAVLGKQTDIDLQIKASDSEHVTVQPLTIHNALLDLSSRIGLNLIDQAVDATLDLEVDELSRLSDLAGKPLAGSADLKLAVDGTMQQPGIQLNLDSKGLAVDRFSIRQVDAAVKLAVLKPLADGFDGRITGEGVLQGMVQGETPLPEQRLDWTLAARVPAHGVIKLDGFHVTGQYTTLNLVAEVDPEQLHGQGKLELAVDQLSALAPESGVKGEASVNADFKMRQAAEQIVVNLTGGLDQLSGLPEGIDELLGRTVTLSVFADVQPKGVTTVSDLAVKAKGLDLSGDLNANMATKALAGTVRLDVPRLELLAASVGYPLGGDLKLETRISGSTDAPDVAVKALINKLSYTDLKFDVVTLDATAHDVITQPNGALDLALKQPRQKITAGVRYRLDGDQLALSSLHLNAPATELKGRFDIDIKKTVIDGELNGGSTDLSRLREWLPLTLAGDVRVDAVLQYRNGRQSVKLKADAGNIDGDFGQLKAAHVTADATDLFGKSLEIQAKATVTGFAQADTRLDSAALTVNGSLSDLALEADVRGHQIKDFEIRTQARLAHKPDDVRVALLGLAGHFGGEAIKLEQSARFRMQGKQIRLEPLVLGFGDARLEAHAEYGPRKLDGRAQLSVPLALLGTFGGPDMNGHLQTDMTLSGTPVAPNADLALDVNALHLNDEAYRSVPDSNITVRARLAKRHLSVDVKAENAALEQPIAAQAEVPMQLTLEPFQFDLPKDKPLQAKLHAALQLDGIPEMLALDGQEMAGAFNLALALTGSLAEPVINGDLTLNNGLYENGATGTILKDITLAVRAAQQRVTLEELSTSDNAGGSLKATGWVAIEEDKGFPFDMALKMDAMQLMDSKDLKANVGADLKLNGNRLKALAAGDVTVNEVQFQLPTEGGGPSIPEMAVEEVYAEAPSEPEPKKKTEPPVDVQLDLTINIPDRVFVRGHGLESEWGGELTVTGSATAPQVLGQIETKRATLELLSHNWKFNKGIVDFDGASPPVPTLDMEASTTTRDGTKTLIYITGPATDPKLKLDSDPTLPQSEILSHLLFGKDSGEISPMQAVQLADAVRVLAGGGSFDAFSGARDTLGVDTLSVGGDSFSTSSVKVGKYLTDKIYMELEQGLKSEATNYSVEVELFPEILLDTEFDQESNGALGLKWKHDY